MTSSDDLTVSFQNLLLLTEHVELDVRIELGPWWWAELEELGVSACRIEGDVMEILEARSVAAAYEVIESKSPVGDLAFASALRVLALHGTGQLGDVLEEVACLGDGPWDD